MVVNRRKKVVKYRGGSTHGGGARKKRRGAGSRGGRGKAGSGKRAGHKKNLAHKGFEIGNKGGFLPRRTAVTVKAVNLDYFTAVKLQRLVETGRVTKTKDVFVVDLQKLGFNKLLGSGRVTLKLKIHTPFYSQKAAEKVKAAGGDIIGDKATMEAQQE